MTDTAAQTLSKMRPAPSNERPDPAQSAMKRQMRELAHRVGVEAVAHALDQAA